MISIVAAYRITIPETLLSCHQVDYEKAGRKKETFGSNVAVQSFLIAEIIAEIESFDGGGFPCSVLKVSFYKPASVRAPELRF
jgi:hypothetical protein